MAITFGSLFAGIGGVDLGFERAGMECRWQVEIDDDAVQVLREHWPEVPVHRDIRSFPAPPGGIWHPSRLAVDVIAGGFPCIDISSNGKRAGLAGRHSSLWWEMLRVIRLLEPSIVVVENVADFTLRGLDEVLGSLAESGFDAEWDVLPAGAFGLPQRRERCFVVAHARRIGCQVLRELRLFGQVGRLADSLLQGERRAAHASRVVRGVDAGIPEWLDTRRPRQEAAAANREQRVP